jgi:hypothetical protein
MPDVVAVPLEALRVNHDAGAVSPLVPLFTV